MIPTFNCAELLRETLESVLSQDPGPDQMQIEVIDDASTKDDPEAVVRELGGDRVAFYRQPRNLGAIGNFNSCLGRSRGHNLHILHGDDFVLPGFYGRMRAHLEQYPEAVAVHTRYAFIDEDSFWTGVYGHENRQAGIADDAMEQAARKSVHQFAGTVFRRSAVERIGGFHPQFIHAADWDMWRRLAVHGPVVYDPTVLACYRMFAGNDSSRLIRTGANMADLHKSINFSARYLPADRSGPWLDYARSFYGWCALDMAAKLFHQGDRDAYKAQLREAIKLNPPLARSRGVVKLRALEALGRLGLR